MKDDMELMRTMFGPVPEGFSRAVERGLTSDVPRVRQTNWRAVWIAAALILLASCAYAMTRTLGLVSIFDRYGDAYPQTLHEAIVTQQPQTITVGPLSFTLVESLSDPYQTYAACTITPVADEFCLLTCCDSATLRSTSSAKMIDRLLPEYYRLRLHMPEGTTFLEAAQTCDVPMYVIDAQLSRSDSPYNPSQMPDITWDEEGNALIAAHHVMHESTDQPLAMTLTITVYTLDPATGWLHQKKIHTGSLQLTTSPVGVTATRTYLPDKAYTIGQAELLYAQADRTALGIYFTIFSRSTESAKPRAPELYSYMLGLVDSSHRRLSSGVSHTWRVSAREWPVIRSWVPTALEEMPGEIIVTDYNGKTGMYIPMTLQE